LGGGFEAFWVADLKHFGWRIWSILGGGFASIVSGAFKTL
jgi:hypothetical protein